ncbi:MAG: diguanylate cyclase [Oscillospiraceae bacterium]|jgi:diguanylate cyclase (GGDEF)-like protein|nr:diguanylate cyclase [Oscillospiraceae bacterium]
MEKSKKINRSLSRRLTGLIIFMIVAISGVMMTIGYLRFYQSTEEYYWRLGETTAGIIALVVDPDSLEIYLETSVIDEEYEETIGVLHKARAECEAQTLYVFTIAENKDGIHYIYDTDTSDMVAELGDFDPFMYEDEDGELAPLYPKTTENQLLAGGKVDTIMGITQYGWTITVNEPLYGSDGTVKGYVGIDFDVNKVVAERTAYVWQLATVILIFTAVFAAIYLFIIRKAIINPINIMAKAADSFVVSGAVNGESNDEAGILAIEINTRDEIQSLAESLKSMVRQIDRHLTSLHLATVKSETDTLTGLCNRGAFEQRVTAIQHLRPEDGQLNCFMMIDVDFFKTVNDTYGHAAGDEVLVKCAEALRSVMRESDVVGRLGGDEFAVFCKGIGSVETAAEKARLIREEWAKIIPPGGDKGITGSIGISFSPQDGTEYQELFNIADEALYKIKESGRDGYALSSAIDL